jgi:hypothetical protein
MTIKWNWGTRIFLTYSLFVVFMLGMVYLCTRQHYDLVTPDYYAQELKYQEVIDGLNNVQALGRQVAVTKTENLVTVTIPHENIDGKGEVKFYRPDNASLDMVLALNGSNQVMVPVSKFKTGVYKIKTSWMHAGKRYYDEQSFYAP